jgi:hypothetical protein
MFQVIHAGFKHDRPEALQRCRLAGMQLPEIITAHEKAELLRILIANGIPEVFAGIYQNYDDASKRFYSTGALIEQSVVKIVDLENDPVTNRNLHYIYDDWAKAMVYTDTGLLKVTPYYLKDATSITINAEYHNQRKKNDHPHSWVRRHVVRRPVVCQALTQHAEVALWEHIRLSRYFADREDVQGDSLFDGADQLLRKVSAKCLMIAESIKQEEHRFSDRLKTEFAAAGLHYDFDTRNQTIRTSRESFFETPPAREKRSFLLKAIGPISALGSALFKYISHRKQHQQLDDLLAGQEQMKTLIMDNSIQLQDLDLGFTQLQVRSDALAEQVRDLTKTMETKIERLDATLDFLLRILQLDVVCTTLALKTGMAKQSLAATANRISDILQDLAKGKVPTAVLDASEFVKLQQKISNKYNLDLLYKIEEIQAAAMTQPSHPSQLVVVLSIPAVEPHPYYLVELVGLPRFGPTYTVYPEISESYVALSHDLAHYFQLSEAQYRSCMVNSCKFNTPKRSLLTSICGVGRYIADTPPDCPYKIAPNHRQDYFLNLGELGIVYSIVKQCKVTLECNMASRPHSVTLKGQGILRLPGGCYGIAIGTPAVQPVYLRGPEFMQFTLIDNTLLGDTRLSYNWSGPSEVSTEATYLEPAELLGVTAKRVKRLQVEMISKTAEYHTLKSKWYYVKYGAIAFSIAFVTFTTAVLSCCLLARIKWKQAAVAISALQTAARTGKILTSAVVKVAKKSDSTKLMDRSAFSLIRNTVRKREKNPLSISSASPGPEKSLQQMHVSSDPTFTTLGRQVKSSSGAISIATPSEQKTTAVSSSFFAL